MMSFTNLNGVPLQGVLIKPPDFDPAKKYPLMVYIYERLSQTLHSFTDPAPSHRMNPTLYASNGYVVLMPDIAYTVGYPGQSGMNAVLPAVQKIVDQGYIDEKRIGIQGHSWGGYQIAYMVTKTNRFRAAAPARSSAICSRPTPASATAPASRGSSSTSGPKAASAAASGNIPSVSLKTRPSSKPTASKHPS